MNKVAKKIWASQRYKQLIDEYIDRPILPPPFILLTFVYKIILKCIELVYNRYKRNHQPNSTKSTCIKLIFDTKPKYKKITTDREELIDWYENMAQEFFCQYTEKW